MYKVTLKQICNLGKLQASRILKYTVVLKRNTVCVSERIFLHSKGISFKKDLGVVTVRE